MGHLFHKLIMAICPNFSIETDCAALVVALANLDDDLTDTGCVVGDCKDYRLAFTSVNVQHIFREANCVAHRLAHAARFSTVDEFWIDNTPSIIEDVIYEDICSRTRGLGLMSPSM